MGFRFYESAHGMIHVADNPHVMACGRKLKVPAKPRSKKLGADKYYWFCFERGCKNKRAFVEPVPYHEVNERYFTRGPV